jgi:phage/plasmid-associated DNA primase
MDKVERFFQGMSQGDDDYDRLVRQVRDVLFSNKSIHILYGTGANGKTALVNILSSILEEKVARLPFESICSAEIDNSYVPYIVDSDYIVIGETTHLSVDPNSIKQLVNGYVCQYRKPYTNNWSQVTVKPKKVIIVTNFNPNDSPFTNDDELNQITNIINFNKVVDPDYQFVMDVTENHRNDVYEFLASY